MSLAKVFKNRVPNCKVFTPAGRQITFHNGKHITQIKGDIKYLEEVVANGDAYVYIDPAEVEVDTEELTPAGMVRKLKREAVEEYLATQAAASALNSVSEQKALGAGTSKTVSPIGIESNGAATVAPGKTATVEAETPAVAKTGIKVSIPATSATK